MNTDQSLSTNEEMQIPPTSGGCGWRAALCVASLLIAFLAGSWFTSRSMPMPGSETLVTPAASFEKPVIVQISGRVKNPGVYELPFNSRIYQAIAKAGGLLDDAQTDNINLADWVQDGSQIVVPSKTNPASVSLPPPTSDSSPSTEMPALGLDSTSPESTFTEGEKSHTSKTVKPQKSTVKETPKSAIDLNRATAEELQQLPGVGPAMSERILQYRKENRGFTSVDDLDNVRGIGPKTLEKIRPFVIVKPLPFQNSAN